mmetsp:Transcript_6417/g.9399  ORF Transcript_6417/g.9399 Transcript_6417/m.9399 type:complete len:140 (-) Transcript_6417:290-709(-)
MQKILILLALCVITSHAFVPCSQQRHVGNRISMGASEGNDENEKEGPLAGVRDFFSNLDSVADDFFYKRMGKGEIFYGKRSYKPSGDVEGGYNGFGLSDKGKIDTVRDYKDAWLEEKEMRDEIRALKEEKEKRSAASRR